MNCFREKWYENWHKNQWLTAKKTPVENRDLWERLLQGNRAPYDFFIVSKGHVNLKSPRTDLSSLYQKFIGWNGPDLRMDDFLYVTEQNNRADALANLGVEQFRL